jgi:acetylornithine deacetylase/succinyl-diaminopimelate desuccinylase-like protein
MGHGQGEAQRIAVCAGLVALVVAVSPLRAQQAPAEIGPRLLKEAGVAEALKWVQANEPRLLDDQVRLCEVPAPPFKETKRGELFKQLLEQAGLTNVRVDRVGNVIATRPGLASTPHLVFSAHLDTVFPEGTDVRVTRDGAFLKGPGIGDDCRGLAVVLGVARALNELRLPTPGTITFVGTVGEEGLGDLRGVKHLFGEELKGRVDRFVSVDGTGYGTAHVGVGSRRYRVTYKGPGGHSFGAFGLANPIHALGRAIARISDLQVPTIPKTTFNVGRVGGGTSVNSIAFEAWMEVDMRSSDAAALKAIDASFLKAVDTALAEENERWNQRGRLTVVTDLVGDRAAGRTPESAPIVQAAVSVSKALGLPVLLDEGSTDSNVPMSLGIPAITIDGGGRGTGAHSLGETFDSTDSWKGTQRALLLALALAQQ